MWQEIQLSDPSYGEQLEIREWNVKPLKTFLFFTTTQSSEEVLAPAPFGSINC